MTPSSPDAPKSGSPAPARPAEPLYRRIASDLRDSIEKGEYAQHGGMPSENELRATYGVSRGTVRQAFDFLRASGVVSSRQGARRQIHGRQPAQSMTDLLSFSHWGVSLGRTPSSRSVESASIQAAEDVAVQLGVGVGSQIFHVERVRLLDDAPVMLESTYYPQRLAPLIDKIDLEIESITSRFEEWDVVLADAEHRIDAIAATTREAELLEVPPGTPLLRTVRRTTDAQGRPAEYSIDVYLGSAVAFVVQNSVASSSTARVTPAGKP